MARESKSKSRGKNPGKRTEGELRQLSAFDAIQELAEYDARHTKTEEGLTLFLKSWWSKTYNRPLKDPLLESYTLHELLYEYYDKIERANAAEEAVELKADKIEEEYEQETLSWIEEEERRDREAAEKAQKEPKDAEKEKLKEDEEWMVEQLKKEYGEDFGKDIDSEF